MFSHQKLYHNYDSHRWFNLVCTKQDKVTDVKLPPGWHQNYSHIDVTKHHKLTITVRSHHNIIIVKQLLLVVQFDDNGYTWRGTVKVYDKMDNDEIIVFDTDKIDGKSLEQVTIVTV